MLGMTIMNEMGNKSSYLKSLWFLGLVLYTPIIAMCLNIEVFNPRSILIILTWTVFLLIPFVIFRKRFLYIIAASLLFVDGFINLFHWIILKCPLNASSIFVFMNTNFSEASEFMTIKMTPLLLLLIPLIFLFIMTLRHTPTLSFKTKRERMVWSAMWAFVIIFFGENIINGRFVRLAVPDVERAFISFYNEYKAFKALRNRQLYDLDAKITTDEPTLVVVIIGESCNRNHMSLYGYTRATTPRLQKRDDIMAFDNVISANSSTLNSVMYFLTERTIENPVPIDKCIHVFDVFHSTPYKSYWISNQSPIGLWDNGVTSLAQNADVVKFVNVMANSSMESTVMKSFDESLIEPFSASLGSDAKHKVVFLHLLGSHTSYDKRYPSDYKVFKGSSDSKNKIIDAYDNSILYNDYIIDHIFSMLKSYSAENPGVRVSALYFSDHGENVYDEGDYAGHDFSGRIPHANVDIPFIFWFSPSQAEYLQEEYGFLDRDLSTPYMIDDLFHTIIDLSCITTDCFDASRSFINSSYDASRPRLLEDNKLY